MGSEESSGAAGAPVNVHPPTPNSHDSDGIAVTLSREKTT